MVVQNWDVDVTHSGIDFCIKHMGFSRVRGCFKTFEATFEADLEDLTTANIRFSIDLASVDTRNDDRDNHLRSADFFDVENHTTLTFTSTTITERAKGEYDVTGDLTLHGVTRAATFRVVYGGKAQDPWGYERAAFSAEGTIRRGEYGLTYNAALAFGEMILSDEVEITVEMQVTRQIQVVTA